MSRRLVDVHLRPNGEYLVDVSSKTVNGFRLSDGVPVRLQPDATAEQIGVAVADGLRRSREGTPAYDHKTMDPARPLLDLVGMPSYARYAKGVRMVGVTSDFESEIRDFRVVPKANGGGVRSGFTTIDEHERMYVFESPAQLGQGVLDAFEFATA
jgi:hypothetical protein